MNSSNVVATRDAPVPPTSSASIMPPASAITPPPLRRAASARLVEKSGFACGEACRVPTIISAADPRQLPISYRFRPRPNILTTREYFDHTPPHPPHVPSSALRLFLGKCTRPCESLMGWRPNSTSFSLRYFRSSDCSSCFKTDSDTARTSWSMSVASSSK